MKDKLIKSIPNILTFSRIITCVAGAISFASGNVSLAMGLYVYGAASDFLDGIAARKLDAFSEFGRKLDAFSDKLYAASLLLPGLLGGNLLMLIPMVLELKITEINLKSEKLGFKPVTQRIGKFKTALLFPTVITGLLATVFKELYLLFLVLLPLTTVLQKKTITVYENILNYNISKRNIDDLNKEDIDLECDDQIEKGKEKKKVEEKIDDYSYSYNNNNEMSLVEEFFYYMSTPYFKEEYDEVSKSSSKVKKRVK